MVAVLPGPSGTPGGARPAHVRKPSHTGRADIQAFGPKQVAFDVQK
jgi:hypothetical protein